MVWKITVVWVQVTSTVFTEPSPFPSIVISTGQPPCGVGVGEGATVGVGTGVPGGGVPPEKVIPRFIKLLKEEQSRGLAIKLLETSHNKTLYYMLIDSKQIQEDETNFEFE